MKHILEFGSQKTYFGINIQRHGIKVSDLEKLPFFDLFAEYHDNTLFLTNGEESYVPLIDWEGFCYDYILRGKYRMGD